MYDEYPEDSAELDELEQRLKAITPEKPHDKYVIASIEEALAAAREGNFGVGAVIVDPQGEIVERGHNHVFHPHFRSDIHAEMDTMNKFEDNNQDVTSMRDYMLFTSLEPCPMCLTRLITSGIGKVYQAAPDVENAYNQRQPAQGICVGCGFMTFEERFEHVLTPSFHVHRFSLHSGCTS